MCDEEPEGGVIRDLKGVLSGSTGTCRRVSVAPSMATAWFG